MTGFNIVFVTVAKCTFYTTHFRRKTYIFALSIALSK